MVKPFGLKLKKNDGFRIQQVICLPDVNGKPQKWDGSSDRHRSFFWNSSTKEVTHREAKANLIVLAFKILNGIQPKLSWLVSPDEFVRLFLKTIYLPHDNRQRSSTHKLVNPDTGNYFVPVARYGEIVVCLRTWFEKEFEAFGFRCRFVVIPHADQEDYFRRTLDRALVEALSEQKEAAEQVKEVRVRVPMDFTPEERERKPKAKARVEDEADW